MCEDHVDLTGGVGKAHEQGLTHVQKVGVKLVVEAGATHVDYPRDLPAGNYPVDKSNRIM